MSKTFFSKSVLGFILEFKYIIIMGFYLFWMLFMDNNNLVSIYKLNKEISTCEDKKGFYEGEIQELAHQKHLLENDIETRIAYGKKKMLVSAEGDDVFYIEEEQVVAKKKKKKKKK